MIESIIKDNAKANPNYRPYCMRCSDLVRMTKVCELGWRCKCGASHDERDVKIGPLPPLQKRFSF